MMVNIPERRQRKPQRPHNHANFESSVLYFNPQWLHQQLMANVEYRMQFADSIYKNYFNGGPMTLEAQLARFNGHATAIDQAILAELRGGATRTLVHIFAKRLA